MDSSRLSVFLFFATAVAACQSQAPVLTQAQPRSAAAQAWQMQDSGTTGSLRGIRSVDGSVAWASGTEGTVLKTTDGGAHWLKCAVPDGDKDGATLDFRGVQAWNANRAIVMSSGPGERSRLYETTDGCKSWTLLLKNADPDGFYDAFTFWDQRHGFLLGDPVKSMPFAHDNPMFGKANDRHWEEKLEQAKFLTLETRDSGAHWAHWPVRNADLIDPGAEGGAAFAASNSSVFIPPQVDPAGDVFGSSEPSNRGWIGVGGKGGARVFRGFDSLPDVTGSHAEAYGFTWAKAVSVPLAGGTDSAGIFSLSFRQLSNNEPHDASLNRFDFFRCGIAVGGDYAKPNESSGTAAWSSDGGEHWTAANTPPHGYRSTVEWSEPLKLWITAGTNGSDISRDDGRTWEPLDDGNWNALSLPFVVGPKGRIARLDSAVVTHGR